VMSDLGLNERQKKIVIYLKTNQKITNAEYQSIVKVTRKTAARDLADLVAKGVVVRFGAGRGVFYALTWKRDKIGTNGT